MSQHDMDLVNAAGAAFRADLNAALVALASNNDGASAPSPSFPNMWWPDTTTGIMKQRNTANTAWLNKWKLSEGELALLAGSASQVFSVGDATAADHAVKLEQVSLFPSVASATTTDIFGAAGATINVTGTTTITGITACTAAQVGSTKRFIPSNASGFSITASASLVVDGATSGTYLMPQNALVEILATSTTTFKVTTIFATGTWTPVFALATPGTSSFTYTSQVGTYTKIGNTVSVSATLLCSASSAGTGTGNLSVSLPFAVGSAAYSGSIGYRYYWTTNGPDAIIFTANTSVADLYSFGSATTSGNITQLNIGGALQLYCSGFYKV